MMKVKKVTEVDSCWFFNIIWKKFRHWKEPDTKLMTENYKMIIKTSIRHPDGMLHGREEFKVIIKVKGLGKVIATDPYGSVKKMNAANFFWSVKFGWFSKKLKNCFNDFMKEVLLTIEKR